MLSNRPMMGITASPPPKSCIKKTQTRLAGQLCFLRSGDRKWKLLLNHFAEKLTDFFLLLFLPFPPYLYNLSKGDDGAVGHGVWRGWGPERWEPLGSFPSDCEHMMTVGIPGKCYEGGSHDHQSVTHWDRDRGEKVSENKWARCCVCKSEALSLL